MNKMIKNMVVSTDIEKERDRGSQAPQRDQGRDIYQKRDKTPTVRKRIIRPTNTSGRNSGEGGKSK